MRCVFMWLMPCVRRPGCITLLQVWDIGGQGINSKMLSKYLSAAQVLFLCYDVTDLSSFKDLDDWLMTARRGFDSTHTSPSVRARGEARLLLRAR